MMDLNFIIPQICHAQKHSSSTSSTHCKTIVQANQEKFSVIQMDHPSVQSVHLLQFNSPS